MILSFIIHLLHLYSCNYLYNMIYNIIGCNSILLNVITYNITDMNVCAITDVEERE